MAPLSTRPPGPGPPGQPERCRRWPGSGTTEDASGEPLWGAGGPAPSPRAPVASAAQEPVTGGGGGAAGPGHVQVGDQGKLGHLDLFDPEAGVLADAGQVPVAEGRGGRDE